jgi:5S rRNA maturation endonuclease (ribonuclease M5)
VIDFADLIAAVAGLLGEPNRQMSTSRELRFGRQGSISIVIAGENRGTWFDHENGVGGGALDLVGRVNGCDRKDAVDWVKAELRDFAWDGSAPVPASRIVAEYSYEDEQGRELFQVVRFEPKELRQRRPDGKGDYIWKLEDVRRVLYGLPELHEAIALDQLVTVVEGEKDVEALRRMNICATCNPGAGKWRSEFAQVLKGAHVVVLPDNDCPGRDHAETVARSLAGVAASVKVLDLPQDRPDLRNKADVSDGLHSAAQPRRSTR